MSTFRLSMMFMKTSELSPSLQDVAENKVTYSKTMQEEDQYGTTYGRTAALQRDFAASVSKRRSGYGGGCDILRSGAA
jgi:hypothetical protein